MSLTRKSAVLVLKIVFALYALHCSTQCKITHNSPTIHSLVDEHTDTFGHHRCAVVLIILLSSWLGTHLHVVPC